MGPSLVVKIDGLRSAAVVPEAMLESWLAQSGISEVAPAGAGWSGVGPVTGNVSTTGDFRRWEPCDAVPTADERLNFLDNLYPGIDCFERTKLDPELQKRIVREEYE